MAIPDTGGEVQGALDRLDELLTLIWQWELARPDRHAGVGLRLATSRAHALERISIAVRRAEAEGPAQPIAPDGRNTLVPLAWARLGRADLVTFGQAVLALGRAWGPGADELVYDALAETAASQGDRRPEDLLAEATRLNGLFWLPWDMAVARLAAALPAGAGRVVLDRRTHALHEQLVDRLLGVWHADDPLTPFPFRGDQG